MTDEVDRMRLSQVEKELAAQSERLKRLEEDSRDIPSRVSRVEYAIQDLAGVKETLAEINRKFDKANGGAFALGAIWAVYQFGPDILKFLGMK